MPSGTIQICLRQACLTGNGYIHCLLVCLQLAVCQHCACFNSGYGNNIHPSVKFTVYLHLPITFACCLTVFLSPWCCYCCLLLCLGQQDGVSTPLRMWCGTVLAAIKAFNPSLNLAFLSIILYYKGAWPAVRCNISCSVGSVGVLYVPAIASLAVVKLHLQVWVAETAQDLQHFSCSCRTGNS